MSDTNVLPTLHETLLNQNQELALSAHNQKHVGEEDLEILGAVNLLREEETSKEKKNAPAGNVPAQDSPPISGNLAFGQLVFLVLVQAATTQVQSATVHAKGLASSAANLEALNRQEENLQLLTVPKEIITYKTIDGGRIPDVKNEGAIAYFMAKNTKIEGERSVLTQRRMVLQQQEKIGMAKVNTEADETSATMTEGSNIQQIERTLTFLALLRQQPQV